MKKTPHRSGSFFRAQIAQIQEEGISAFYRKVRKLLTLLFMGFFAPLAVYLGMDWPGGYYFVGNQLIKKYKRLSQDSIDPRVLREIEKIEDRAILCLKKYIAHKPNLTSVLNWVNASSTLFHLAIHKSKCEETIHQKTADVVHEVRKNHQLESLGIEFIPRGFAAGSIGVYDNLEVYIKAGILGLRPPKKLILLLDHRSTVNNPCYLSYWSQYLTIISDPSLIEALSPLEKSLTVPLAFYMAFYEKALSSPLALGMVREKWDMEKRRPILTISDKDYQRGWQCLKTFGIPQGAWFVCLHVRESGWNNQGSSENFRNADIKTYLSAVKAVVDAGGWVIRMGDPAMTPLPQMDHVIDYAHSHLKSDWMDVFLCSQCRFIIGTSSGIYTIPIAFDVPVVMTNLLPAIIMYQFTSRDIFIPRICRSNIEHRILAFQQLMSTPLSRAISQCHYDSLGVEVVGNTAEEIRDVVMEMLGRFDGTFKYSEEDEYLQGQFKSLMASGEYYGDKNITVKARIGQSFLRKYASLLPSRKREDVLR